MARQKRRNRWKPVPVEWIDTWWADLERAPFQLEVSVDISLKPITEVVVLLLPCDRLRQQHPVDEPNFYRDEYEVTGALIREVPSDVIALRLKAALSIVQWLQGLEPHEGLAFIVFLFILFNDVVAANQGKPSMLKLPKWGEFGIPQAKRAAYFAKHLRRPAFRLKALLHFWDLYGAHRARGIRLGPQDVPGRTGYLVLPPQWLSLNDLQRLGEANPKREVPVLVKPQFARITQNLVGLYEEQMLLGGSLDLCLRSKTPVMALEALARDVFRWDGEHWRITWEGFELPRVPKLSGLHLIHFLMQHEGEQFPGLDLLARTLDKDKAGGRDTPVPHSAAIDLCGEVGLRKKRGFETAIERGGPGGYEKLRAELDRLEGLRDLQEDSGSHGSDELQGQIDEIKRVLRNDYGAQGQTCWIAPERNKARVRVNKALKFACRRLRRHCADLATHLENAISRENATYSYRPDRKIDWSL